MKQKVMVVASRCEGSGENHSLWQAVYTSTLGLVKSLIEDQVNIYAIGENMVVADVPYSIVEAICSDIFKMLTDTDSLDESSAQLEFSLHGVDYIIRVSVVE